MPDFESLPKRDYDAVVVGSGPNGLAAAILMQLNGLSVLIVEGKANIGGGLATQELTLPGFKHDVCSAIHPLAINSPFFRNLPLADHGLQYIHPTIACAHPLDDGSAGLLHSSIQTTAKYLPGDEQAYTQLISPVVKSWPLIENDVLGPLHFPKHPFEMAEFGLKGLQSAEKMARIFTTERAKALFGGLAAHSMQPLSNRSTAAIALALITGAHLKGWPVAKGGSASIAAALGSYFISLGGVIETNTYISSLSQLPSSHAVLFDVTPKQMLQIAGHKFSAIYKWQLNRYRYGMGVFKMDWALDGPVPFVNEFCHGAGTVHLGGTFAEIADAELAVSEGKIPQKPFVLFAQQSLFDHSRAPKGMHTGWAYCHVPNGSVKDMTIAIENQIERFAPGFKDIIIERHTMNPAQMQEHNPNYIGGDINGGIQDIKQLFTRPALRWSPYRTSAKGLYICSSSTPPGGGVHGMCGYHAAKKALKDVFDIKAR